MMFIKKKPETPSIMKIVFITSAIVLGVLAVVAVLCKLRQKYCLYADDCCEFDDCFDDDDCDDFVEIECEDVDPEDPTLAEGI